MAAEAVIVVGAGLAGLAAARHLQRHGIPVVVLEGSDGVGGRVRTDIVEGFRLDRGFQLLNPAYPEARRVLDLPALALKPFVPGAEIVLRDTRARVADPRRQPSWAWSSLCAPVGSLLAEARVGAYIAARSLLPVARLSREPDTTMAEALRGAGADDRMIDRLLRPFLSGVFLEPDLATARRYGDLVLRSFLRGTPSVPSLGMQAMPEQLARGLDIRLHSPVRALVPGGVETGEGRIDARAVVVAVDPPAAADLVPGLPVPTGRAVTTFYHRAQARPEELTGGAGVLVLDGTGTGPVVNTVVLTHAAPSYSATGDILVSSSVLGLHGAAIEPDVRAHLARLYGVETTSWDHLATYPIRYALPAFPPGTPLRQPVRLGDGRYVAGDHRDTPSIQGALVSGRRAATAVLRDLGVADER